MTVVLDTGIKCLNLEKVLRFILTDTDPRFLTNPVFSLLQRTFVMSMCDTSVKMGIVGTLMFLIVHHSSNVIYDHMFLVSYKNLHKCFAASAAPS